MTLPNSDLKDGTRVVCEYKILTFIGNSLKKKMVYCANFDTRIYRDICPKEKE